MSTRGSWASGSASSCRNGPPPEAPPARDWAWLVQDRASTNLTPYCYLVSSQGCLITSFSDPNHDPWNDCKGAGHANHFQDYFKAVAIVANTFYGPFDSSGFHSKSVDAAISYKRRSSCQDPKSLYFLPAIASDLGESDRLHHPNYASEVWDSMGDGRELLCKAPRLALCRCHSIQHVHEHLRQIRTKRLVMWLYLGVVLGYVKTLQSCYMVERLKVDAKDAATAAKGAMKTKQAEEVAKERAGSQNTLHFATRVLLNATWMRKGDIFYCISKPVQTAQGSQAKHNKGDDGALAYSLSMARGGGYNVLLDIVGRLQDTSSLSYMGCKMSFAEVAPPSLLSEDQVFFALREEREWLELVVNLVFSLVGARALNMQSDWAAFPGKAVLLLSDDAEELRR